MSWETICCPKEEGCVRIRSLHQVMQALHIGVEFYTIKGTLFSLGYVHAKQTGCPHRAVLSSIPRSASHCWRAIHAQLDFFLSHALWSIGKGNIFWHDMWLNSPLQVDKPPRPHISVKEAFNDPNI